MKTVLKILIIVVVVLLLGAGAWWIWGGSRAPKASFKTAEVKRGDLFATIGATGTIEPEEVVDVGAQVAGMIDTFGVDPNDATKFVDYGTHVEKGTVLARIDSTLYADDVASAQAQLDSAKASVVRAQADLGQMQAKLVQAQNNWNRAKEIGPSSALSSNDYDMYKADYESAKATVGVGEAAIVQAQKMVEQSEASLRKAQRNLEYCTITSPVKGVIIDRRVNTGQTVVSSLNAPSLFLIAKDLNRMQVWASVNEADIGSIHPNEPVTFTVDAFPGEKFKGEVGKVRLNATMTQNVVTYTVEVVTDNSSGRLLPYLTANVSFEVNHHQNVLLVPNAALRWIPQPAQVAPDVEGASASPEAPVQPVAMTSRVPGASGSSSTRPAASRENSNGGRSTHGTVWVQDGAYARPIKVHVGLTDNTDTEVQSDDLKEGMGVIIGESLPNSGVGNDSRSPFAPQMPSHKKKS